MIDRRFRSCFFGALCALVMMALVGCGASSVPAATDVPAQEVAPPATKVHVAAETASATEPPVATETSEATQSPAATETPVDTGVPADTGVSDDMEKSGGMAMRLTSTAFDEGGLIPPLYTCDDQDISPPLEWEEPPAETQSFAMICDDPDAPGRTWVHWVMYNIPLDSRSLAAGLPAGTPGDAVLPDGTQQGQNSWPRTGYGGPCPPSGTHRYIFNLYALDITLDLAPAATDKTALLSAMEGHVLAEIALTGLYERQR